MARETDRSCSMPGEGGGGVRGEGGWGERGRG